MAILASDIIKEARYVLSDISGDRWTDERLLLLLNAGIDAIAKNTTLFVETFFYVVQNNVVDIDLSPLVTKIVRAEYLDNVLPIMSFEQMDKKDKDWQKVRGDEVKALVFDKQKNGLLKQYPIVENAQNDMITYVGQYGIVTDIAYSDIAPIVETDFGDLGDIPPEAVIKFYYIRKHSKVTDIETELNIDELVEPMLKHYVAGFAFRDNQDTQSRALSNEELTLYNAMLDAYNIEKTQGFVRPTREVTYNAGGV